MTNKQIYSIIAMLLIVFWSGIVALVSYIL